MEEAWLVRFQCYINTGGTVRCYCKLRFCIRSAGDEESAVITRDQQHLSETFCFTGTTDVGAPVRRNQQWLRRGRQNHRGGITGALGSCAPQAVEAGPVDRRTWQFKSHLGGTDFEGTMESS